MENDRKRVPPENCYLRITAPNVTVTTRRAAGRVPAWSSAGQKRYSWNDVLVADNGRDEKENACVVQVA